MTKEIPITKGHVVLVSDDDFDQLSKFKWHFYKGYAARMSFLRLGKRRHIMMHQEIMGRVQGMEIDHRNLNKLDNRRENLRICTHAQNNQNEDKQSRNTSGFKGVNWHKASRKWRASIRANNKQIALGVFDSPVEAAMAYDKAAVELHGEFARTNFPGGCNVNTSG